MNYVIGCGGVGSWLIPGLWRLAPDLTLIDGDRLEPRNLDRQLFDRSSIGKNKAEALAEKYGCKWAGDYFYSGYIDKLDRKDMLFCAADNHTCRREVLETCDRHGCRAVLGGNEYTDAEAYWYEPGWRGGPNDPRVVYPVIENDHANDPRAPEGCTGDAADRSPQLVLANAWAASFMLHLHWYHTVERKKLPRETEPYWPVHHMASSNKFWTIRKGDRSEPG